MDSSKTIVLITGANGGIGFETASIIVNSSPDYHVIIGSRSLQKGEKAILTIKSQSPKGTLSLVQLDVTDEHSIAAAAVKVEKDFGRLDVLINNAGIVSRAPTLLAQFRETFETNLFGAAVMTETFTPLLLKSASPKTIYVSSSLGSISRRMDPTDKLGYSVTGVAYRTSKAGMNMLMACDHATLGSKGLKTWTYCPGYVVSNLSGTGEKGVQERRDRGAGDPKDSARGILALLEGERDADVGKFVHAKGVYAF